MPLLRYRTGDLTFRISTRCRCGRASPRIGPIVGRKAQRLTVKGTVLYPKAIENALLSVAGVENCVIEVLPGHGTDDDVAVKVGATNENHDELRERVCEAIKAVARVTPSVEICSPVEIDRMVHKKGQTKPVSFIDRRPPS